MTSFFFMKLDLRLFADKGQERASRLEHGAKKKKLVNLLFHV